MNVLSLFDGMSCGLIALKRVGLHVDNYLASEIDKYAIQVAKKNHPEIQHIGDVTKIDFSALPKIDLLIAGSPCQGFSFAGKQLNFNDPRSALFFKFVEALSILKPKYFLLENVKMKKEYQEVINELLGVTPIEINSSLVSAQNRKRLYWTNIQGVKQPQDKGVYLKDIIEGGADMVQILRPRGNNPGGLRAQNGKSVPMTTSSFEQNVFLVDRDKSTCLDANYWKGGNLKSYFEKNRRQLVFNVKDNERVFGITENSRGYRPHRGDVKKTGISELGRILKPESKTDSITTNHAPKLALNSDIENLTYRKLTPIECERLQTVPDNYTELNKDIEKCYANKKIVIERQGLKNLETIVCSTIKESRDMETLPLSKIIGSIKTLDVSIATSKLLQEECAEIIITTGIDMETRFTLKKSEIDLIQEGIIKERAGLQVIELLFRKLSGENLTEAKLYIILIAIKAMIQLRISMFAKGNRNTQFCIDNLKVLQGNLLEMDLLNLRTVDTKEIVSNTQRYKMLGNGWTVDVIAHIFKNIEQ